MNCKFIFLFLISLNIFSRNLIVQKPVIFISEAGKSQFEIPVKTDNLININKNTGHFFNNLDYKSRKKLVNYALKFNNTKGRSSSKFRNDCSGFTRRVYSGFNIELFRLPPSDLRSLNGKWVNGVELIWKYCRRHGHVFTRKLPKEGDIVFFDNTYDRNKNKQYDDYFTHIGIVVKVDKDRTVHYIHKATKGIIISKLNMKYENKRRKGKKEINSFLRRRGKYRLSGQLVRGFGSLFTPEKKKTGKQITQNNPKSSKKPKTTRKSKSSGNLKVFIKSKNSDKKQTNKKPKLSQKQKKSIKELPVSIIPERYREKIVKKAVSCLGKKIKKEDFAEIVYLKSGFNILDNEFNDEPHKERGIFWTIRKNGRLFSAAKPERGDLIFFDKLNGNKLFLDIAIIEKTDGNQITFIHSLNGTVKRGFMNRKYWKIHQKNNKIINSYFIKDKNSKRKLSSDFFRRFGSLFSRQH